MLTVVDPHPQRLILSVHTHQTLECCSGENELLGQKKEKEK